MSIYKSYTPEQIEDLQSQFIVRSWSYSKVGQFARNQKAFELIYIMGWNAKSSASNIAGKAYHEALKAYFKAKKEDQILPLPELEKIAFAFIEEVPANSWKLQKTTPSVDECKMATIKSVTQLLANFYQEKAVYEDHIAKVLDVEVFITDYLTINGVDIPLPCNMMIDLVIETHEGLVVILDHKSKKAFSGEDELKLTIGKQAITYTKGYENYSGRVVDEVWFCENKSSKNRNAAEPQLNMFRVPLDINTRRLYEALLYGPLKQMIEAVNNPDYDYIINDSDNFVDRAELYEFWMKTLIDEVDAFDIDLTKKDLIEKRMRKIRDASTTTVSPKVIKQFKANAAQFIQYDLSTTDMTPQNKVEHILRTFGIVTQVAHTSSGYSSNTFLLDVSAGTKISSIQGHKLDLANALNVPNVRIPKDLKVYEGKSYLQIETAKKRESDLIWNKKELVGQKIPLGKDNFQQTIYWDLDNHSTPHVLICGATGSGKSASLISTIEYAKLIKDLKGIVILDPKYEFLEYNSSKKIEVVNDIIDIEDKMAALVEEMNELVKAGKTTRKLIVIDEFADAVAQSRKGKELDIMENVIVGYYKQSRADIEAGIPEQPKMQLQKVGERKSLEENLRMLLQKGRSVGYRIVSATQRASTKVITGDAKVNYPIQICFRVPKAVDSTVVLDDVGAETLAGYGDGLIKSPEYTDLIRFQAFYKPQLVTA